MADYTVTAPHCVSDPDYLKNDCGSPVWAYGLFISWNILSMYIFTNMVQYFKVQVAYCSFSPMYTIVLRKFVSLVTMRYRDSK